jgi:hypothetical protein
VSGERSESDVRVVTYQLGRRAREPWSVAAVCRHGLPAVIVSPSTLSDGTPFPDFAWLTCPHLRELVSARESAGAAAEWADRAAADEALAARLQATDDAVRAARTAASGGQDACAATGACGQRSPLGVKCLHGHVALALVGIDDPIGEEELAALAPACDDRRCGAFTTRETR